MISVLGTWDGSKVAAARLSGSRAGRTDLAELRSAIERPGRLRLVFGLEADSRVPKCDEGSLNEYYRYLVARLQFPFETEVIDECEGESCGHLVTAIRLIPPKVPASETGLESEIRVYGGTVSVALSALRPHCGRGARELLDDYRHWLRAR